MSFCCLLIPEFLFYQTIIYFVTVLSHFVVFKKFFLSFFIFFSFNAEKKDRKKCWNNLSNFHDIPLIFPRIHVFTFRLYMMSICNSLMLSMVFRVHTVIRMQTHTKKKCYKKKKKTRDWISHLLFFFFSTAA